MEIGGDEIRWNRRPGRFHEVYINSIERLIGYDLRELFFVKNFTFEESNTTDSIYCTVYLKNIEEPVVISFRNHINYNLPKNYIVVLVADEANISLLRFHTQKKLVKYFNNQIQLNGGRNEDYAKPPKFTNFREINNIPNYRLRRKKELDHHAEMIVQTARQKKLRKKEKRKEALKEKQHRKDIFPFEAYFSKLSSVCLEDLLGLPCVLSVKAEYKEGTRYMTFVARTGFKESINITVRFWRKKNDDDIQVSRSKALNEIRIQILKEMVRKYNIQSSKIDPGGDFYLRLSKPKMTQLEPIEDWLSRHK